MIFVIGLWLYFLAIFFSSEEENLVGWIMEWVGLIGIVMMLISVSMFLVGVMP